MSLSISIISSIVTSITLINANSKRIIKRFIRDLEMVDCLDTYFLRPSELETNDSPKLPVKEDLNNSIKFFVINPNIISYCVFSLDIYEYPKYHQHQYYYNQLKNHRYINII